MGIREGTEYQQAVDVFKREYFKLTYLLHDGNLTKTAKIIGINRATLRVRLIEYGYILKNGDKTELYMQDKDIFDFHRENNIGHTIHRNLELIDLNFAFKLMLQNE